MIGKKIKSARFLKNYTQEYMANVLDISQKTYSNFENDKSNPTLQQLEIIAKELETDLAELIKPEGVSIVNNGGNNQQAMIMHNLPNLVISQFEKRIEDLKAENENLKKIIDKLLGDK